MRLSSPDDGRAFQWLYGLFYVTNDSDIYQEIYEANLNTGATIGLPPLFYGSTPSIYREYATFVNFDYQFTSRFDVQVGGVASYIGNRLGDFANTPETPRSELLGYLTADLRTGIEDREWTVTLYVKNVGDKMGYVNAHARDATTGISAYGVSLIQPRTVGLSINKNW